MRGRFNAADGHLYACGMSAWGTSQTMRGGDFYRLRYTGKPFSLPVQLAAEQDGMTLTFANVLDETKAKNIASYEVQTWDLVRSRKYGSDRYNTKTLLISEVKLSLDNKRVKLMIPGIKPVDVMTIAYRLVDSKGNALEGKVQNTIHDLGK